MPSTAKGNKEEVKTYTCSYCGNTFTDPNKFYISYSGVNATTGRIPMCKDCVSKLYTYYFNKYSDSRMAIKRICMIFDFYYSDSIFDALDPYSMSPVGDYVRKLNMKQHRGKTFDTSLDTGFSFDKNDLIYSECFNIENDYDDLDQPDSADVERWGPGFDRDDYNVLNSHYKLLKTANPGSDINQEIFIKDLCLTKMQQLRAVREGRVDDYNKLTESYRKSFQQAGLKTVKDSSINEEFTVGVTAETIEKYTPAEYYRGKELYKDYDNIGDYITRFLLRPIINLQFGKKDRDYEFYVKDEEDDGNEYEDN